jgi:hypothetical protein
MAHDVIDDLERRLRTARPAAAAVDPDAFDGELLARVRDQPIARRRTVPRAVALPVAAGVSLTATAVVVLGGPGDVGGPSSAAAISQALRWLTPPPGTILHAASTETQGGQTTTHEFWESADDPASERELVGGARDYETSGDAIYDPSTDTIYEASDKPTGPEIAAADKRKRAFLKNHAKVAPAKNPKPAPAEKTQAVPGTPGIGKPGDESLPAADPIVTKMRILLQAGRAVVKGREVHDGTDAWAITLSADAGRPPWTLWVSAADGRPLEVRDPGRDASEAPQVIRWTTYEVLPDTNADRVLTLTGAHPGARVVHDPAQADAAVQRLTPPNP